LRSAETVERKSAAKRTHERVMRLRAGVLFLSPLRAPTVTRAQTTRPSTGPMPIASDGRWYLMDPDMRL